MGLRVIEMSRRRKVLVVLAAAGVVVLGIVGLRVAPVFLGPALPAGATRLHIVTYGPTLSCMSAALPPVRVATSGDELVLVTVASGDPVKVAWPSGFAAWRVHGRAVVADPWGNVVGKEGDVLDGLGGGLDLDGAFLICPFGIVTKG